MGSGGPGREAPAVLAGCRENVRSWLMRFDSVEKIAAATADSLSEIPGIGGKTAERILAAARGETPSDGDADKSESDESEPENNTKAAAKE